MWIGEARTSSLPSRIRPSELQGVLRKTPLNSLRCGGCWAFAAVEAFESQYALATGALSPLSVQQLIDCVSPNSGCDGGASYNGYHYLLQSQGEQLPMFVISINASKAKGLASEWTWPFIDANMIGEKHIPYHGCNYNATLTPTVATLSGYTRLPKNSVCMSAA